jgi:hypothetical protein
LRARIREFEDAKQGRPCCLRIKPPVPLLRFDVGLKRATFVVLIANGYSIFWALGKGKPSFVGKLSADRSVFLSALDHSEFDECNPASLSWEYQPETRPGESSPDVATAKTPQTACASRPRSAGHRPRAQSRRRYRRRTVNTRSVLREAGLGEQRINQLVDDNIVFERPVVLQPQAA